ncbi:PrpR N-terminal domain-containing protein [Virgibacillus oceani]
MKVVAIVPYNGLKEIIQTVKPKVKDINIEIKIGDLEKGVKLAKEAEMNGANILISRGGTAKLIKKNVKIPVIEIEVSAYDLLRVFTLIKGSSEKKAIVGFKNVVESAMTISNLIEMEISSYTIEHESDVTPKLKELQRNGYQIIVGDTITVNRAETLGLNGLLLTSGKESVQKALEEAVKFEKILVPEQYNHLLPKALLDQQDRALIVLDNEENIVYKNKSAYNLGDVISHQQLKKWVDELSKKKNIERLLEKNGQIQVLQGYLISFNNAKLNCFEITIETKQEKLQISGLKILDASSSNPLQTFNWFTAHNNIMKDVISKAKTFTIKDENVIIYGEIGTGKERLASLMHIGSRRSDYPMMIIDCENISSDNWKRIFQRPNVGYGIIYNNLNGTVYLKKVDKLSIEQQKVLLEFIESDTPKPRIISSSTINIEQQIVEGNFSHELNLILGTLKLRIPPLRERKEDFETLVKLFINKFNFEYGKEVAGIRPEALQELQKKPWLRNIDELMQFIKEVILVSNGPFINLMDIERISEEHELIMPTINSIPIDKPLKDIELAIIKKVFKEENHNYTQTAKRLGINRTTLWRKLKD